MEKRGLQHHNYFISLHFTAVDSEQKPFNRSLIEKQQVGKKLREAIVFYIYFIWQCLKCKNFILPYYDVNLFYRPYALNIHYVAKKYFPSEDYDGFITKIFYSIKESSRFSFSNIHFLFNNRCT